MLYGNTIQDVRQIFFTGWDKYKQKQVLQPLEQQVVEVILGHPEYHRYVDAPEIYRDKEFLPELDQTNPFLHMALHLAVREQVSTNRPAGIAQIYAKLLRKNSDHFAADHRLMEVLAEFLWKAQSGAIEVNDENYYEMLEKL